MNDKLVRQYSKALPLVFAVLFLMAVPIQQARADGFGLDYAVLFEGGGSGNHLNITNVTVNGNVGVGGAGLVSFSGPGSINGALDFSASNSGQYSNTNGSNVGPTSVIYNAAGVTSALATVNAMNVSLGSESGTNVSIGTGGGQTLTINASAGQLDAAGNRVFNVTGFNTTNGNVLTINGDAAGDNVVLNFIGLSANFNNQVVLNGLSSDQVLYNFVGGSGLSGGPTLQINDNASSSSANVVQGVFLDPNGTISVVNSNVLGDVYGGDSHDMQIVSGDTITQAKATPEPGTIALLGSGLLALVVIGAYRKRVLVS